MVEKKAFQTHHRNISSVSDVSVQIDPIKREDAAEIKVVFLLESDKERNVMFEVIQKSLQDGQSEKERPVLLNHHWEQNHNDCTGPDCAHCVRTPSVTGKDHNNKSKGHFRRGSADTDVIIQPQQVRLKSRHDSFGSSLNSHEGYFRFFISGQPIRLMLLSKDKQNLLRIISFDFLVVCMQVTRISGLHKPNGGHVSASLDDNIWEFEWKRLQRHSKKFLAPVILLGYFRDILRLGQIHHGHVSLEKVVQESKLQVQKVSRKARAIPRFCDFVTGTSQELFELFSDLKKMFLETGYILQQCALANNTEHF